MSETSFLCTVWILRVVLTVIVFEQLHCQEIALILVIYLRNLSVNNGQHLFSGICNIFRREASSTYFLSVRI